MPRDEGMWRLMASAWASSGRGRVVVGGWALLAAALTAKAVWDRRAAKAFRRAVAAQRRAEDGQREGDATPGDEEAAEAAAARKATARRRLRRAMRLALGRRRGAVLGYGALLSASLIGKLMVHVKVSKQIGVLGGHLASRNWGRLWTAQINFAMWTVPAAALAALVAFSSDRLSLAMRGNIVEAVHARVAGERGDGAADDAQLAAAGGVRLQVAASALDSVEQRATEDAAQLAREFANAYQGVFRPLAELVGHSVVLGRMMGWTQLAQCYAYFLGAGAWTRMVGPRFSALTVQVAEAEGGYRSHHARIAEYAEEIDLIGGGAAEASVLRRSWRTLRAATSSLQLQKLVSDAVDGYTLRHMGVLAAFTTMIPAVYSASDASVDRIASGQTPTEYFLACLHLLVNVGLATRDLVLSHRPISAASGLATRVMEHVDALDESMRVGDGGAVATAEDIAFSDVDVVTPTGTALAQALTFTVRRGQRLFVNGPNGAGKTALLRLMRGLWKPARGEVNVPPASSCMFLPQRAYVVPGLTLREQLTYPNVDGAEGPAAEEVCGAGGGVVDGTAAGADEKLLAVLRRVGLGALASGPESLESTCACDGLSAGERQRLAIARMLLRAPRFAVLDEATSAVPESFEAWVFDTCVDMGITLVTVSHRAALMRYHTHALTFDGKGQWRFYEITASTASIGSQ